MPESLTNVMARLLEVSGQGRYLHIHRGFLVIEHHAEELGRIPLDDIEGVISVSHSVRYSQSALTELAKRNIPLVVVDRGFSPVSVLWPLTGHFNQAAKIDAQLSVGRVLKKRLWQAIVKNKILAQAMVLEVVGQSSDALRHMASRVRSGDEGNLEAQASRRYWPLLFGADFRRERHGKGPNPLLNYGYAVIRSAMARAVVATGLHPSVGIFHSNRANAFRLVDDLMEPFRPFVDAKVWWLYEKQGCRALNTRVKRALVDILEFEVARDGQKIRLRHHINHFAQSLGKSYLNKANELVLPEFTAQVFARLMQDEEEQVSSDVVDGDV